MAPDLPPVKLAINELVRTGVHVVTLFSDVAGSMRETHVGADNRAAGRTAGLLLGRMAGSGNRDTLLLSSQASVSVYVFVFRTTSNQPLFSRTSLRRFNDQRTQNHVLAEAAPQGL
jgi:ABC-type sugar transport system substrate-binding protein